MALITRQITRTSQPQELVGLDASHPLVSSLVRAVDGRSLSDLVSNSRVTKNGSVAYSELNGSSFGATSSIELLDAPCGAYTLFALAYAYTGASGALISRASGAANYDQNYGLLLSSGTTPQAGHKNASGGAYPYITSSIAVAAGSLVAAASAFDGSTTRVYTNGVLGGSVAATAPYTSFAGVATQIGATDGASRGAVYVGRGVKLALIFSRALSTAEIKSLSDNPWQLFEPITETIWIPDAVSVGGGTTNASITSTDAADTQSSTGANLTTAQVSTTDAADTSAATVSAGSLTSATVSVADGKDATALTAANWMRAQVAQADGPDATAIAVSAGSVTLASAASTDGADIHTSTAANWITAQTAQVDAADVQSATAANWTTAQSAATDTRDATASTGNIVSVTSCTVSMGDAADMTAMQTLVTTGAVVYGTDGADTALITAGNWAMAIMASVDSADVMAMRGGDPSQITLIPNPRMTVRGSALTRLVKGNPLIRIVR